MEESKSHKEQKSVKKIILDTSTLLYDALAFRSFRSSDIYIPFSVLEEIDAFKRDMGEKGRNARHFNRYMDVLRQKKGSLIQGVAFGQSSSSLFVIRDVLSSSEGLDLSKADHRILAMALFLKKEFPESQVELISKNINLRIKADIFGIEAKDYKPNQVPDFEDLYTGVRYLTISENAIKQFQEEQSLEMKDHSFYPNQYVLLEYKKEKALGRYNSKKKKIEPVYYNSEPIWGVYPQNMEQSMALDALLNDSIMLVSLLGKAGTGKTLLALAAGLHKTLEDSTFQKLLVSRPVFPIGRDIGYLPGDIGQKLNPWMQPIFDSVGFLMGLGKKASRMAEDLMNQGLISIEPLAYIRGRSIPNQYLIVDEAQNLTPHEIKTVLTRAGQGTKVILTGDCYQIDNPYIDSSNNGLVYAIEKFKQESISAHITLNKGERSDLAELAANIL